MDWHRHPAERTREGLALRPLSRPRPAGNLRPDLRVEMSVEPKEIVDLVERFVNDEHDDDRKYTNRTPLDESGVWTLHQLAAEIYALGFDDCSRTEEARQRGRRGRKTDADRNIVVSVPSVVTNHEID